MEAIKKARNLIAGSNSHPNLFRPLELGGGLVMCNRIVLASLTRNRKMAPDVMLEYYVQRSTGGLTISEGTLITPQGKSDRTIHCSPEGPANHCRHRMA